MFSRFFYSIAFVFCMGQLNGQVSIAGWVTNDQSGPLSTVSIHLLNTTINTLSDKDGYFNISGLTAGSYTVELSCAGYANLAAVIEIKAGDNQPLTFRMHNVLLQLETVTVSAEKTEALLQNIPVSITAVSAQQVQELRLWNSKDLTAIVPNLYSGNSGDERNVTSIRGITTTSYDPAVATYIDGVNQFSLDTYIPQLSDIERIEVLRGPQGTLYGRNAMGGVINIITKQPGNNTNGFLEINIGNYNRQRYSAGIRTALIKDKLFFGASGVFNKRNGYYKNEFNNRDFDRQRQITGNYYLKYLAVKNWVITLNVKHQNNQNDGAFPLVNGVEESYNRPFQLSQDAVGRMIDNTLNTSLSVNHTSPFINFSSQLAWQTNHRYYKDPIDGDFSPLDAVTVINDYGSRWNNVKVLTHELRFTSPAGTKSGLNWTGGTYFFHQYNPVKQATHFGREAAIVGAPDTDFSTINTTKGRNTGFAFYGQANYSLSKKLMLIAGLRYDYENKKLEVNGQYQKDGQDAFVTTPDTSAALHYNAVSPKLGLQYGIAANSNVYANYSRGFRTGGLTQLSSDPSQPPLYPYMPEYSNNIELGIKNNLFGNRFVLNAAIFFTHVNNAQVPTLLLPDAITVTKNTGALDSKGAELELSAKPAKGFQVMYNIGYTDAKYKSLKLAGNGQNINLVGKKQIFTPDVTSVLTLQYTVLLSERRQIKLIGHAEWYYSGRKYFDLANTIQQSPYQVLNARAGITSPHLEVFFWIRNISNETYIEYAYDFGAVHLGDPRTLGVTVRTMF